MDEIGPWHTGAPDDANNTRIDSLRTHVLWSTLTAGGAGVEWYFGWLKPPNDLNAEDLRSRSKVWKQASIARDFFEELPYTEMKNMDDQITTGKGYLFGKENEIYLLYLESIKNTSIDMREAIGEYDVFWFDPRSGGKLQKAKVKAITASKKVELGNPPSNEDSDWVVLIKKKD